MADNRSHNLITFSSVLAENLILTTDLSNGHSGHSVVRKLVQSVFLWESLQNKIPYSSIPPSSMAHCKFYILEKMSNYISHLCSIFFFPSSFPAEVIHLLSFFLKLVPKKWRQWSIVNAFFIVTEDNLRHKCVPSY